MDLLERPICFKVVEGASIMHWYIFLKLHKVLLSLLTPRYLLLAHLFVLRCMLPDTRCSVLVSRSLRADWIFNWLLAVCYFPLVAVYRLLLPQFSLLTVRYSLYAFSFSLAADCRMLCLELLLLFAFYLFLFPPVAFVAFRFSLLNVCWKHYCFTLLTFCCWELATP